MYSMYSIHILIIDTFNAFLRNMTQVLYLFILILFFLIIFILIIINDNEINDEKTTNNDNI